MLCVSRESNLFTYFVNNKENHRCKDCAVRELEGIFWNFQVSLSLQVRKQVWRGKTDIPAVRLGVRTSVSATPL